MMFFYSLYTPTGFFWESSNLKLQACPLFGAAVEKYWKKKQPMIYGPKHCWVNIIPQPIFHSSNTVFILQTKDYRMRTSVIPDSCFRLLSTSLFFWFASNSIPNIISVWEMVGVWVKSVLSAQASGKWFDLASRLIWFFPGRVAALTPQGDGETEHSID